MFILIDDHKVCTTILQILQNYELVEHKLVWFEIVMKIQKRIQQSRKILFDREDWYLSLT